MYRTIFEIGPVAVHSYGLMLALAFFGGVWYVKRQCKREKLPFEQMLTIAYILIFCGVIGARLAFVAIHWPDFAEDPFSAINPFHGDHFGIAGLNLYGGIILAVIGVVVYLRLKKLPLLAVTDLFAPTVGLGLGIARIGCFLNGCCFGTPTDSFLGVHFPEGSIPWSVFGDQAIHPAQLYSSAYGLVLFFILHKVLKKKKFDGQVLALLFIIEAVFRYIIEYVRYYETEMSVHILGMHPTYNQLVSVMLIITGAILYWKAPRTLYRTSAAPRE